MAFVATPPLTDTVFVDPWGVGLAFAERVSTGLELRPAVFFNALDPTAFGAVFLGFAFKRTDLAAVLTLPVALTLLFAFIAM